MSFSANYITASSTYIWKASHLRTGWTVEDQELSPVVHHLWLKGYNEFSPPTTIHSTMFKTIALVNLQCSWRAEEIERMLLLVALYTSMMSKGILLCGNPSIFAAQNENGLKLYILCFRVFTSLFWYLCSSVLLLHVTGVESQHWKRLRYSYKM